jgi:hypothetical protein
MVYDKHEGSCKFNVWIQCGECTGCEKCGWNPDVAKLRKQRIYEKMKAETIRTRCKKVYGLNANMEKLDYTPTIISVRVTADEQRQSLSLADESKGVMLLIPLEAVSNLLKMVEDGK